MEPNPEVDVIEPEPEPVEPPFESVPLKFAVAVKAPCIETLCAPRLMLLPACAVKGPLAVRFRSARKLMSCVAWMCAAPPYESSMVLMVETPICEGVSVSPKQTMIEEHLPLGS